MLKTQSKESASTLPTGKAGPLSMTKKFIQLNERGSNDLP